MKTKIKKFFTAFLFFALTFPLHAQIIPEGMNNLMDEILNIFTGSFVKTILIICLAATAVVFGFNKDNEKMKRNCIAIGIAIAVVIGASAIVDVIWTASGGN